MYDVWIRYGSADQETAVAQITEYFADWAAEHFEPAKASAAEPAEPVGTGVMRLYVDMTKIALEGLVFKTDCDKPDAYVELIYNEDPTVTVKTASLPDTKDASWEGDAIPAMQLPEGAGFPIQIDVKVWDKDESGEDDLVGETMILLDVLGEKSEDAKDFSHPTRKVEGSVAHISVNVYEKEDVVVVEAKAEDGAAPAADGEATAAEPAAEGEATAAEPAAEGEAKVAEPAAEGEAKAAEPAAEGEAKAAELAAEGEAKAAEPAAEGEAKAAEPAAEGEAKAAEPAAEGEAKAAEPAAEGEAKAAEPAAEGEAKDAEPAAEGEAKVAEPAAEGEAKAAEPAAEGEAKAAEPAEEGDAKAAEPAAEGEAKAAEPAAEGEAKAAEPAAEGEAKADEPAAEAKADEPATQ